MKRLISLLAVAATLSLSATKLPVDTVTIKIVETTDVHGNFFPEDFINRTPAKGSLSRVHSFVEEARNRMGRDHVVVLDNGDILQGQPSAYYYNYIDTVAPHLVSQITSFMGYDASTVGNHDIETGHAVYDRWIAQNSMPTLGANIIDTTTGKPYLKPYTVIERDGIKIAVLGMLTPAIPAWLPEKLWEGLRFDDMTETAKKWVPYIKEKERPDLLVGMFHSGRDSTKTTGNYIENGSMIVARNVPGFDIVLMGHDHSSFIKSISNIAGESVLLVNPANSALKVGDIDITFIKYDDGSVEIADINGTLTNMDSYPPSPEFLANFAHQRDAIDRFVSRPIGEIATPLSTREAYFGPSAFIDFIHQMQLDISGADISFAAPLSFDATIPAGEIHVSDMFNLYKYENMLYTMELTGSEIKDYLEMAYDLWTNQMHSPDDHLLRLREGANASDMTHTGFQYPSYNFDSAAGIIYTVDVTKPRGEKISIKSMADGSTFHPEKKYKVAVNSYRGNGGGNLLTQGAGIPADQLAGRIIDSTDKDLRYYLMQYIIEKCNPSAKKSTSTKILKPKSLNQWQFIPESYVKPASKRDFDILF